MFCPECGKKNEEGAQFCEHCGARIVDDSKVVLPKQPRKPMSKRNKIIITVSALLIVILVIGGIILSENYKPSKVATDYFEALMDDDANRLYNYIDVPENEFTTKKIFTEVVDNKKEDLVNYQVVSEEVSTDGLSAQVKISYTLEGRQTPLTKTIYLVKDKKNKMLIFDNWKISDGSSLVETDYQITVFKDSTLKLEGVLVDEKYKEDSESSRYDTYVIPALFKGDYDAQITLRNGLTMESKIDVSGYSSTINTFELSDKNEKSLEEAITDNINKIYKSAIDKKAFNDIKNDFNYKDADLSDLEDAYNSLSKSVTNNELMSYELTDVEIERLSINDDGNLYVTASLEYKYSVKEYFSEDVVSNSDDDTAYLTFDYNDGFKLVDFTSLATYFSRF